MSRIRVRNLVLPIGIIESIDGIPDRWIRANCYNYVSSLINKGDIGNYHQIPAKTQEAQFRGTTEDGKKITYTLVRGTLEKLGIIQVLRTESGQIHYVRPTKNTKGVCQSVRLLVDIELMEWSNVSYEHKPFNYRTRNYYEDELCYMTKTVLSNVSLSHSWDEIEEHERLRASDRVEKCTNVVLWASMDLITIGNRFGVVIGNNEPSELGDIARYGVKDITISDTLDLLAGTDLDLITYESKAGKTYHVGKLSRFRERKTSEIFNSWKKQYLELQYNCNGGNVYRDCKTDNIYYSHRLHHSLTNLKSEYLNYVLIDGSHICSIDLVNSQFTLFAAIIKTVLFDLSKEHQEIRKEIGYRKTNYRYNRHKLVEPLRKAVGDFICSNITGRLGKSGKVREDALNSLVELIRFVKYCECGKWYEYLESILHVTRSKAKLISFACVFSSTKEIRTNRYEAARMIREHKQTLKTHLPTFYKLVEHVKKNASKEYYQKEWERIQGKGLTEKQTDIFFMQRFGNDMEKVNSNSLPITLQNWESFLFIGDAMRGPKNNYHKGILHKQLDRGFMVLSRHDSIICKDTDKANVLSIISKDLDSLIGKDCYRLKIEHYENNSVAVEDSTESLFLSGFCRA